MPEKGKKPFGAYLQEARTSAGYACRDHAAVHVPISASVIGRHERGELRPAVDDARAYARAYDAPELLMHYCRSCCPIGSRSMPQAELRSVSALENNLRNRLRRIASAADRLADIADDDRIDETEREDFDAIVAMLVDLRSLIDNYVLLDLTHQKTALRCERKSGYARPLVSDHMSNYKAVTSPCQGRRKNA